MSQDRIHAKINLKNIVYNLDKMHELTNNDTKIIAVIKANGYGHGAIKIAKYTEHLDYLHGFAVATTEEALDLRTHGIKKPILILGYTFPEDYEALIQNDISLCVFKPETACALSACAAKLKKDVTVHIKVDTGMSRIGLNVSDEGVADAVKISDYPHIITEGIMTHFSKADEKDKSYTGEQYDRFCDFINKCEQRGINFTYKHCSNSAAIMDMPGVNMDIVRCGVTLYGLMPSAEVRQDIELKPAMSLHSRIVHIKDMAKDIPISYGGTYITSKEVTKVATVPVGYADGYPRSLSNKGYVLIRGQKAPILGRVCMDQMMVDVSDIDNVKDYDEVVLMGNMGNESISAETLGDMSGRFNYELVCDISERVPRIYEG